MKLHTDSDAFSALLLRINENIGIRSDVLEKDYYVTLFLKELSEWQKHESLPAYFKGGTALYKALASIRRFSEDIDLTVCVENCSNSQAKRRLVKAANGYKSLPRTETKDMESNHRGSITSVYDYKSILGAASPDPIQRFGHVKVEATSFTISEPFAPLTIAPIVFERATEEQKSILQNQYDVVPFDINTIRLERIFVDKVFAAEFYYQRQEYFDVSKHIYDLSIMVGLDEIQKLLSDSNELTAMIAFKRREEKFRIGSGLSDKSIADFEIFRGVSENSSLRNEFMIMQGIYIFDDKDKISFHNVIESLSSIESDFSKEQPI